MTCAYQALRTELSDSLKVLGSSGTYLPDQVKLAAKSTGLPFAKVWNLRFKKIKAPDGVVTDMIRAAMDRLHSEQPEVSSRIAQHERRQIAARLDRIERALRSDERLVAHADRIGSAADRVRSAA
jgi:hypothetical protein